MITSIKNYFKTSLSSQFFLIALLGLIFCFITISHANAGGGTYSPSTGNTDNTYWSGTADAGEFKNRIGVGNTDPRDIIANIINIILGFLGIISVCLIMYAGFLWMTSDGNSDKINKAKKILIGAIIGLILIISAFSIAAFVLRVLYGGVGGTINNTLGCVGAGCNTGPNPPCVGAACGPVITPSTLSCTTVPGSCSADPVKCQNTLGPMWSCNPSSCICEVSNAASCYNATENICNYPCRAGLSCYGLDTSPSGSCEDNLPVGGCGQNNSSCYCCCSPSNDQCGKLYSTLKCKPDTFPCDSATRGMCCGCSKDSECGTPATTVGCGEDTCCRARPEVKGVIPSLNSTNVCTNAMIQIDFDQAMKSETYADSIMIIAEYAGPCPSYTKLVNINDTSIPLTFVAGKNYCAIDGGFGSMNDSSGFHLYFILGHFMDIDTTYHIVVRGDMNIGDDINQGIESYWGVSMNGSFSSSFKTVNDTSGTGGVCVIDKVDLSPSSYLFRTNLNSAREKDTVASDPTFDIDKDKDKAFVAKALSPDSQVLASIPGYQWDWVLTSSVTTVVSLTTAGITDLQPGSALAAAVEGVTDGRSIITAAIDMTNYLPGGTAAVQNVTAVGNNSFDKSDVFVFICDNPWPPVDETKIPMWSPWQPTSNIYNYDIYYCRDKGKKGTVDDLPAYDSQGLEPVAAPADEIRQQSYFTYKDSPPPGVVLSAESTIPSPTDGGSVTVKWSGVPTTWAGEPISGYKVHWGETKGVYKNHEDVRAVTEYNITGLKNDTTYYFSVTAYTANKAESSYFEAKPAVPRDLSAPVNTPVFIQDKIKVDRTDVLLGWGEVSGVDSYELSYGLRSGPPYGMEINMDDDTDLLLKQLTPGTVYYFNIRALDSAGNKSSYGTEFSTSTLAN